MIKRIFHNIKQFLLAFNLKKNNRPFIFLVCLFIATILWFLNALGKQFETTVSMPVKYTNLPKNKALVNPPPSSLEIKMEAHGLTLLRHKLRLTINPLIFDVKNFTNNEMNNSKQTKFSILSDRYIPQFSRQITSEIKILDISPDTLVFEFDQIISEKKKIAHDFELSFENQYFLDDSIKFTPDSVLVRGPRKALSSITEVKTKRHKFKDLNASIKRNIVLENVDNVDLEPRRVQVEIPVSQYTEYNEKISLVKINVPDSMNLITLPGKIDISCLVATEEYKNLSPSSFIIGVDYSDITNETQSLPVTVYRSPGHIKLLKHYPVDVKFIIEKKK